MTSLLHSKCPDEQLIHPIVFFLALVLANFDTSKFRSSYGVL